MKIDINIDESEIREIALKTARDKAEVLARRQIGEHFQDGSYWGKSKGVGYLAIEEQIDNLLCGPEIAEKVRLVIAEKFDAILEQQVTYQLTRRAKKLAAAEIKERGSDGHQLCRSHPATRR